MSRSRLLTVMLGTVLAAASCGSDPKNNGTGGSGGDGGDGGDGGSGGTGGSGAGGRAGSGGSGGSSGSGGTGGTAGMGGSGGTGGAAGSGGAGGATVDAGVPDTGGSPDTGTPGAETGSGNKLSFFVTSRVGGGNLGGLEGADMICKTLATAVGAGNKTWRAYLSNINPMVHAKDRVGAGPWFNAKGEMVAKDVTDLHDGAMAKNNITAMTVMDETGKAIPGRENRPPGTTNEHDILTGTQMDGTLAMGQTCGDWKMENATARVGHFDRAGGMGTGVPMVHATSWNSSHNSQGCTLAALRGSGGAGRFYCFAAD